MSSRRNHKPRQGPFERPDYTPEEAANLLYGDAEAIAAVDRARPVIRPVPLNSILIDEAIQARVAGLDIEKVESYAVILAESGEFPPVDVFRDNEDDEQFYLADGFHRLAAARRAGVQAIKAAIRYGGRDAAVEWAEEANLAHGKALSAADKRNIFERRIKRGHEWANLSDREVSRLLGVAHTTIGRWRSEIEGVVTGANAPVSTERTYVTKHGTMATMKTGRIQQANQQRAQPPRSTSSRSPATRYEPIRDLDPAYEEDALYYDEEVDEQTRDQTRSLEERRAHPVQPSPPGQGAAFKAFGALQDAILAIQTAGNRLSQLRLSPALNQLPTDKLVVLDQMLEELSLQAQDAPQHVHELRARLAALIQERRE